MGHMHIEYYAQISTDPDYDKDSVTFQLNDIVCNQNNDLQRLECKLCLCFTFENET